MRRLLAGLLLCVLFVSFLGGMTGCASKKPVKATFTGPESQAATVQPGGPGALGAGKAGGVEEGLPQDRGKLGIAYAPTKDIEPIYFAFDSSALTGDSKAKLEAAAKWLKQNPNVQVKIEGNCDERGTTEYNLALGERRALSARRYLMSLGIDSNRISTLSYGKERPLASGHDEEAWRQNRRDDFKVSM